MRRFSSSLSVVTVVLLGLSTFGGIRAAAQEATPAVTPNLTVSSLAE